MPTRMTYRDRARARRRCMVVDAREEPTAQVLPIDAPSRQDLEPTEPVNGFQVLPRVELDTAWMDRP